MKSKIFTLFFLLSVSGIAVAQSDLFIDTSPTAEQMVIDFFSNTDVTPSNITFNGAPVSIGYFEGADTDLGLTAGIVLSTGDVSLLPKMAEEFASTQTGGDSDADLSALSGGLGGSFDAAVLEFDIVSSVADLDFTYVFGSEEYPDFTSSTFTDVFGFFVTAPGQTDPENIALVPGTTAPVSIGNVNDMNNPQYYVDYSGQDGIHVAFNGLTSLLSAPFQLTPGETYHVKLGVTDIGDAVYDSGVFIDIESLQGTNLLTPPAIFQLAIQNDNTIALTNESRYATSWTWDFGDGNTSTDRHPGSHTYDQPGTYTVSLTTQNYCCSDTYSYTVEVGTTGIEEVAAQAFKVSPNPATDLLNIELEAGTTADYRLQNALGQKVLSGSIMGTAGLEVGHLDAGLYFLTVRHNGEEFTQKVMLK